MIPSQYLRTQWRESVGQCGELLGLGFLSKETLPRGGKFPTLPATGTGLALRFAER